jgi:hypothetical protein
MTELTELERAYEIATTGSEEPNMALMGSDTIVRLYRRNHPTEVTSDEAILAKLRTNKLVVSFDDGIWILCKDEIVGG